MKLRLTIMGRGYDVLASAPEELEVCEGARIEEALAALKHRLPARQSLPTSCLVVHNGRHLGTVAAHENPPLADQDDLLLIAPVAGG